MEELALLAVVAALFALQLALIVYAGVRRSGDGGFRSGLEPAPSDRQSVADPATVSDPREESERTKRAGSVRCHACGTTNDDAFQFCRQCTSRLPEAGEAAAAGFASGGTVR